LSAEQFTISRRPGWVFMGDITVTIECDPLAAMGVKLGLAVKTAFKAGANLAGADLAGADLTRANLAGANLAGADLARANLAGANLAGANLAGAYLTGADLAGANLAGANLAGAEIRGETVTRIVGQAVRLTPGDQYTFTAFEMEAGGVKVLAGCRWFTIPEFRAHVASQYPDTDKAADTLEILDYLERRALRVGAMKPDEPAPKKPRTKAKPALATQDQDLRGGR
jgi:hypothetical protein